jgi:hypothetical protein
MSPMLTELLLKSITGNSLRSLLDKVGAFWGVTDHLSMAQKMLNSILSSLTFLKRTTVQVHRSMLLQPLNPRKVFDKINIVESMATWKETLNRKRLLESAETIKQYRNDTRSLDSLFLALDGELFIWLRLSNKPICSFGCKSVLSNIFRKFCAHTCTAIL